MNIYYKQAKENSENYLKHQMLHVLLFRMLELYFKLNGIKFSEVKTPTIKFLFVRPRPNVELFMRRNKLGELSS